MAHRKAFTYFNPHSHVISTSSRWFLLQVILELMRDHCLTLPINSLFPLYKWVHSLIVWKELGRSHGPWALDLGRIWVYTLNVKDGHLRTDKKHKYDFYIFVFKIQFFSERIRLFTENSYIFSKWIRLT